MIIIKWKTELYNNGTFLGKGAFGIVKKCYSKIDKKDYAIKYVE